MSFAARGDVELRRHVAVEPDPAAELHPPAAHRRRHVVEADAAGVETDRAVDRVERVGHREVPDPAVGDRRAAGEHAAGAAGRRSTRSARRVPTPRTSRKKPCRMPRLASPAACSAIRSSLRPTVPDTRSRVSLADQLQLVDPDLPS